MAPISPQKMMGRTTNVRSSVVAPQQQLVASPADTAILKDISKSLTNIIQLLSQQNVQTQKESEQNRKEQERNRRKGIELGLERSFATVKTVAQSVVAPVKSILDQIIDFFVTIFIGRALILLLNWFGDPKNRNKIRSIMRFLSDWWPSLVAGYILFGTGFGRVVRKVAGIAVGATARLVVIAARLAKAIATGKGLKGAAAAFSGGGRLGGLKGFALRGGLAAAATIGTGIAVNKMMGGGETPQLDVPDAPETPSLGAFGGGFASIKDLFNDTTSSISSKVSPFTAFFGSGGLASLMQGMNGVVSGPKGIDKVPAMLTDGEFVMSRGAVQKFGVSTLEAMNAAGGGTNRPKIVNHAVHANSGGLIGNAPEESKIAYSGGLIADRKEELAKQSIDARLKRIEQQVQIQRALASGSGVQTAAGMGFGTTYQGKKSILVKGAIKKLGAGTGYDAITVPKINVGGMEYFAQQRGKDIIYTSNYASGLSGQVDKYGARSRGYGGVGAGLLGGSGLKDVDKKDLPKSKIMMGPDGPFVAYLAFKGGEPTYERPKQRNKGMLESLTDFFDPKGARGRQETLNARTMRMTAISDMEDMRRRGMTEENIKKMLNERLGPNGYSRASNDLKAKETRIKKEQSIISPEKRRAGTDAKVRTANQEFMDRGGLLGGVSRGLTRMFGTYKDIDKVNSADKESNARIKQAEAAAMGKYYSSSDGKYYKDYAAAEAARKARLAKSKPAQKPITPTPKPQPKVVTKPTVAGGGQGGRRGSGSSPSVPKFSASSDSNRQTRRALNIR